jgi:peptidoglycan DL-endopeptidase CwlO
LSRELGARDSRLCVVWVILRGMSLDQLVAEAGRALGDARRLFGPAPANGAWSSTQQLATGGQGVEEAVRAAAAGWKGAAAAGYGVATNRQLWALDHTVSADAGTGPPVTGSGQAATAGGGGMDDVLTNTRAGVAAIAPSTGTAAGKRELVTHLQSQLDRAKGLLRISEQRNLELAALIERSSAGYGPAMGTTPMPGAATMGGTPTGAAGGGGGVRNPLSIPAIPGLSALTGPTRHHHHPNAEPADNQEKSIGGGGPAARMAVKAALTRLGCPYVWGAKGPNAFDCSGLIRWAYAQAGITLGPDTYSQIQQGASVPQGSVQAGDLIFPNTGHVMLAISPSECVEAQQSGVPVKISSMPSSYVARRPPA